MSISRITFNCNVDSFPLMPFKLSFFDLAEVESNGRERQYIIRQLVFRGYFPTHIISSDLRRP